MAQQHMGASPHPQIFRLGPDLFLEVCRWLKSDKPSLAALRQTCNGFFGPFTENELFDRFILDPSIDKLCQLRDFSRSNLRHHLKTVQLDMSFYDFCKTRDEWYEMVRGYRSTDQYPAVYGNHMALIEGRYRASLARVRDCLTANEVEDCWKRYQIAAEQQKFALVFSEPEDLYKLLSEVFRAFPEVKIFDVRCSRESKYYTEAFQEPNLPIGLRRLQIETLFTPSSSDHHVVRTREVSFTALCLRAIVHSGIKMQSISLRGLDCAWMDALTTSYPLRTKIPSLASAWLAALESLCIRPSLDWDQGLHTSITQMFVATNALKNIAPNLTRMEYRVYTIESPDRPPVFQNPSHQYPLYTLASARLIMAQRPLQTLSVVGVRCDGLEFFLAMVGLSRTLQELDFRNIQLSGHGVTWVHMFALVQSNFPRLRKCNVACLLIDPTY